MQNNSFLFIAIIVIIRVISISFPALETCVTLVWTCPIFVCLWGAHTSILWCMICIQVVGWGGHDTFSIKVPLDCGPMRWCFRASVLFHKKAPVCYRHFAQCLPWPWLLFLVCPKEPLQSLYEGCSPAPCLLPTVWMTRREESSPVADISWKNHYNINENNKEGQRRFSSRTATWDIDR